MGWEWFRNLKTEQIHLPPGNPVLFCKGTAGRRDNIPFRLLRSLRRRPQHVEAGRADGGGRCSPPSRDLCVRPKGARLERSSCWKPLPTQQEPRLPTRLTSGQRPLISAHGLLRRLPPKPFSRAQRSRWNHLPSRSRAPAWLSHPGAVRAARSCGPSWVASPPVRPKGVLQL